MLISENINNLINYISEGKFAKYGIVSKDKIQEFKKLYNEAPNRLGLLRFKNLAKPRLKQTIDDMKAERNTEASRLRDIRSGAQDTMHKAKSALSSIVNHPVTTAEALRPDSLIPKIYQDHTYTHAGHINNALGLRHAAQIQRKIGKVSGDVGLFKNYAGYPYSKNGSPDFQNKQAAIDDQNIGRSNPRQAVRDIAITKRLFRDEREAKLNSNLSK